MSGKKSVLKVVNAIEENYDALKARLSQRLEHDKPLMIQPYTGFGNKKHFFLSGRVLRNKLLKEASEQDSIWENLLAMYKRFNSDEIPFIELKAHFENKTISLKTDHEGYFFLKWPLKQPLSGNQPWHTIKFSLSNNQEETIESTGKFLIPSATSKIGIISDIDDTVLRTNSSNLLSMARLTLLNNAHTRLPFEGVAAFYRALHKGTAESSYNPLFYVSSSPWNLYDLLEDFFELHHIPMGPFLLRDLGIDETKFIKSAHGEHKIAQIEQILETYPEMQFILIGDSGEKDPEIFAEVVKKFKTRIRCIYVRDVSDLPRDHSIRALSKEVAQSGVEMVLVENSEAAAHHAAAKGFIDKNTLGDIAKEKEKDLQAPDGIEQLTKGKNNH